MSEQAKIAKFAAAEVEVSSPGAASSRGKYALGSEHQPKLVVQLCTS